MHLFLLASWLGILDVLSVAFQDSQASQGSQLMSQASQASALGELLQNTELETGGESCGPTAESDVREATPPRARAPLSSVLAAAANSRTPQSGKERKERKRAQTGSVTTSSPATKRYRGRKTGRRRSASRDDDETSVTSNAPKVMTEEEIQKRRRKRHRVIENHKKRADYKAFVASHPRANREPSQPMTPDPEEDLSKRPWETKVQKWRKYVRTWYAENVPDGEIDDDISDISEED
eukprot:g16954.t1